MRQENGILDDWDSLCRSLVFLTFHAATLDSVSHAGATVTVGEADSGDHLVRHESSAHQRHLLCASWQVVALLKTESRVPDLSTA